MKNKKVSFPDKQVVVSEPKKKIEQQGNRKVPIEKKETFVSSFNLESELNEINICIKLAKILKSHAYK